MSCDVTESLKLKLAMITKQKLRTEADVCKQRNVERTLSEELSVIKTEMAFQKEQLEEIKIKMSQLKHQIAMIDICKTSEITKVEIQKNNISAHKTDFECFFEKERSKFEMYQKEIEKKIAAEQEMSKKKGEEAAKVSELQAREVAAVEQECDSIERECAVLKKRNNAIMLKLRRKLVEAEKLRRELMKKNVSDFSNGEGTEPDAGEINRNYSIIT